MEKDTFQELMDFKKAQKEEEEHEEVKQLAQQRTISRKSKNPKQNARNFGDENRSFGVTNEVDLVLQRIAGLKDRSQGEFQVAKGQYGRQMINYSEDLKAMKQKKRERYLTVQSLLDHPYFLSINNADISTVID